MKSKLLVLFSSKTIQLVARLILGTVFIYASLDKIFHPLEFSKIIYSYKILPNFLVKFTSLILPWIEFVGGIFLISGIFVRGMTFIFLSMLTIFIISIVINIIRGVDFNCGCFSVNSMGSELSKFLLVLRDLLILIPGIIIVLFNKKQ